MTTCDDTDKIGQSGEAPIEPGASGGRDPVQSGAPAPQPACTRCGKGAGHDLHHFGFGEGWGHRFAAPPSRAAEPPRVPPAPPHAVFSAVVAQFAAMTPAEPPSVPAQPAAEVVGRPELPPCFEHAFHRESCNLGCELVRRGYDAGHAAARAECERLRAAVEMGDRIVESYGKRVGQYAEALLKAERERDEARAECERLRRRVAELSAAPEPPAVDPFFVNTSRSTSEF